ncbi:collagen alpha-1(I) chain-like [Meriones unguiculatus]|uniref:collagen alpha-1(I) chain-like n=1 Tax=Meriones unguiculatus TaxID=10047 RepID=UPI000B4F7C75|nr:collagen alpha-1(I) chain-like [Meriones unguiculatus]
MARARRMRRHRLFLQRTQGGQCAPPPTSERDGTVRDVLGCPGPQIRAPANLRKPGAVGGPALRLSGGCWGHCRKEAARDPEGHAGPTVPLAEVAGEPRAGLRQASPSALPASRPPGHQSPPQRCPQFPDQARRLRFLSGHLQITAAASLSRSGARVRPGQSKEGEEFSPISLARDLSPLGAHGDERGDAAAPGRHRAPKARRGGSARSQGALPAPTPRERTGSLPRGRDLVYPRARPGRRGSERSACSPALAGAAQPAQPAQPRLREPRSARLAAALTLGSPASGIRVPAPAPRRDCASAGPGVRPEAPHPRPSTAHGKPGRRGDPRRHGEPRPGSPAPPAPPPAGTAAAGAPGTKVGPRRPRGRGAPRGPGGGGARSPAGPRPAPRGGRLRRGAGWRGRRAPGGGGGLSGPGGAIPASHGAAAVSAPPLGSGSRARAGGGVGGGPRLGSAWGSRAPGWLRPRATRPPARPGLRTWRCARPPARLAGRAARPRRGARPPPRPPLEAAAHADADGQTHGRLATESHPRRPGQAHADRRRHSRRRSWSAQTRPSSLPRGPHPRNPSYPQARPDIHAETQ